jgi:hypothetical protein
MCHEPKNIIWDLCFDEVDFLKKPRVGAIILKIQTLQLSKLLVLIILLFRWEI